MRIEDCDGRLLTPGCKVKRAFGDFDGVIAGRIAYIVLAPAPSVVVNFTSEPRPFFPVRRFSWRWPFVRWAYPDLRLIAADRSNLPASEPGASGPENSQGAKRNSSPQLEQSDNKTPVAAGKEEVYEILERALALIERSENWCQGVLKKGDASYCAVGAVNFSASGGIVHKSEVQDQNPPWRFAYDRAINAINRLAEAAGYSSEDWPTGGVQPAIAYFNNDHSHAEVVALFQEAIRAEKAKAGVPLEITDCDVKAEGRKLVKV